jgi:hypothetical protein
VRCKQIDHSDATVMIVGDSHGSDPYVCRTIDMRYKQAGHFDVILIIDEPLSITSSDTVGSRTPCALLSCPLTKFARQSSSLA